MPRPKNSNPETEKLPIDPSLLESTKAGNDAEAVSESTLRYLKAVFIMTASGVYARISSIASVLGVSVPAVSMALRRLQDMGLVESNRKKGVKLTDRGLELVMRYCAKRMMIDSSLGALGLPSPLRIVMAKILEIGLDDDSVVRLWVYSGSPRVCPMGNTVYTFEDVKNLDFETFARRASACCHMKELLSKSGA